MAALEEMPLEILQEVYVYLSIGDLYETADLSALSRASKTLRSTIEPYLYCKIGWLWDDGIPWKPELYHPPIHLLVRSILNRPSLAQHVKTLTFRGDDCFTGNLWRSAPALTSKRCRKSIWGTKGIDASFRYQEFESLMTAALFLSSPEWRLIWLEELVLGDVDILVAVLLSQLFNLRTINLDTKFQRYTILLSTLLEEKSLRFPPRLRLSVLESVNLNAEGLSQGVINEKLRKDWYSQEQVLSLLHSPSIKSLDLSLPPSILYWPMLSTRSSRLTSLILAQSYLSEVGLSQLLTETPALQRLHYQKVVRSRDWKLPISEKCLFDCKFLLIALQEVQATLKDLVLSIKDNNTRNTPRPPGWHCASGRLDSLHKFKNLKNLQLPISMLWGHDPEVCYKLADPLPTNLGSLHLTDEMRELEPQDYPRPQLRSWVEEYLEERHTCAAELKELTMEVEEMHGNWHEGRGAMGWCQKC